MIYYVVNLLIYHYYYQLWCLESKFAICGKVTWQPVIFPRNGTFFSAFFQGISRNYLFFEEFLEVFSCTKKFNGIKKQETWFLEVLEHFEALTEINVAELGVEWALLAQMRRNVIKKVFHFYIFPQMTGCQSFST